MTEVGKAAGQVVIESVRDLRGFLSKVFGPVGDEIGLTFQDQAKYWRYKNALRLADKVDALHAKRGSGAGLRALPFGDAYKVLEAASEEEGDEVQDLWASLIANATDPKSDMSIKKVHVDLLKAMSGLEAAVLKSIRGRKSFSEDNFIELKKYSSVEQGVAIENLIRLRCVAIRILPHSPRIGFPPPRVSTDSDIERWLDNAPNEISNAVGDVQRELAIVSGSMGVVTLGRCVLTALGQSLMEACSVVGERHDRDDFSQF